MVGSVDFAFSLAQESLRYVSGGVNKKSPVFFGPDIGGSSGGSGISIVSTSYASNPKNNPKNLYIFGG